MPKVTPLDDGPLLVQEAEIIRIQGGEDQTNLPPKFGLCRCGKSANKPFCDGAHAKAGFVSLNGNAKLRDAPITYSAEVDGKDVAVSYTPVLCGHIAECQRLHSDVFDPSKRPWIQPENGTLEGILSVIRACPSGALRVSVDGTEFTHIDSDEVSITVVKDGPYVVKNADVEVDRATPLASEKECILCRCGHSKNKPFCDGTHHDVKWRDADQG